MIFKLVKILLYLGPGIAMTWKSLVLPFWLLLIHCEIKLIYNQSNISQFWLMYHIAPISIDHQWKGQRFWEGLTALQWLRPGNTFNSITSVNSKAYTWIPEWHPSVCLPLEDKKKAKNIQVRESGHLKKYTRLQRSWYSLQHLQVRKRRRGLQWYFNTIRNPMDSVFSLSALIITGWFGSKSNAR